MFWFNRVKGYLMRLVKPSIYISGMDHVFKLWQESNTKERGILLLTFSPMFVSMGGVLFSIVYFVLFVLPSFLFSVLGWGILTALFGAGGKYCYKYFTGKEIKDEGNKNVIDVDFSEDSASDSDSDAPEAGEAPAAKKTTRKKTDA